MEMLTLTQTSIATKVALGIALSASAAFAAVSLNQVMQDQPAKDPQPIYGGAVLTRELCWQGCQFTYESCTETGHEEDACRGAFNACNTSCEEYPLAETLPGYTPPGYESPGYMWPAGMPGPSAPGYDAPGYIVPGYDTPGYMTPGYTPFPFVEPPRASFCLNRCSNEHMACVEVRGAGPFCDNRQSACEQSCPFQTDLPPGYIPPAPLLICDLRCAEEGRLCDERGGEPQACGRSYAGCIDACHSQQAPDPRMPDNPAEPPGGVVTPPGPSTTVPILKREPPWFTDDNPPDPIAPGKIEGQGSVAVPVQPSEKMPYVPPAEQDQVNQKQVMEPSVQETNQAVPAADETFFDKVWNFFTPASADKNTN